MAGMAAPKEDIGKRTAFAHLLSLRLRKLCTPSHTAIRWTCARRFETPLCSALASTRPRTFWLETEKTEAFTAGVEAGVNVFVFRSSGASLVEEWKGLARFSCVEVDADGSFVHEDPGGGRASGFFATCVNAEDVDKLLVKARDQFEQDVVVMDAVDGWRVIPTENLIAARQQQGFSSKIMVVVGSTEEAERMLNLLDVGVDGVVLRTENMDEIRGFGNLKQKLTERSLGETNLSTAIVRSVRNVGTGDRVCVDCCSSMREDEMMFVGNAANGLFGVLSEAVQNSYVSAREFRFNAGPVHAYCLVPGGQTRYLSELAAGDEVVVASVSEDGQVAVRSVVVGRCKIERRPLVLVSVETEDGQGFGHFMQNAETCRLSVVGDKGMTPQGCSISNLTEGTRVVLRLDTAARHMGLPIAEYLVER